MPAPAANGEGNFLAAGPYMSIEIEPVDVRQAGRKPQQKEIHMDAKYNWLIDSVTIRVTLNTVAFALWIATAVGLLEIASKL